MGKLQTNIFSYPNSTFNSGHVGSISRWGGGGGGGGGGG